MRLFFLLFVAATIVAGCEAKTDSRSPGEARIAQPPHPAEIHAASSPTASEATGLLIEKMGEVSASDSDIGNVASDGDEVCDFDQNEQIKNNALLKEKYRGSRLEEGYVVIPVEEGEIWVGIGGCAHFGITVELRTKSTKGALTEAQFMAQILYLGKTYSQDYVDPHRLDEIMKNKKWESNAYAAISKSYLIHYDGNDPDDLSRFEAYEEVDETHRTVGFTYSFL